MIKLKSIIIFLCVSLSLTSISFFKIGLAKFSLFHALVLILLPVLLHLALKTRRYRIRVPKYFGFFFVFICLVNFEALSRVKMTSFVYSLLILLEILLLYNLVPKLEIKDIKKVIKAIISLYFVSISISSVFIAMGVLPKGIIGEYVLQVYNFDGRIRPYGFSDEPSYAAITLVFSLFVLFKCDNFVFNRKELGWYLLTFISILLTRSSYGYLLLGILIVYYIVHSRIIFRYMNAIVKQNILSPRILMLGLIVLIVFVFAFVRQVDVEKSKSVKRLVSLVESVTSSDESIAKTVTNLAYVDGSASMRLVPSIHLINNFSEAEPRYVLFGMGAGQATRFFSAIYEGNTTLLGFLPAFVYNYGLVGTLLAFLFFFAMFPKHEKTVLFFLFFLFLFNADMNTQLFLFVMFIIMTCKHLDRMFTDTGSHA